MSFREIQNTINRLHAEASETLDRINALIDLKNESIANPVGPKGNCVDRSIISTINDAISEAERRLEQIDIDIDYWMAKQAHMQAPRVA